MKRVFAIGLLLVVAGGVFAISPFRDKVISAITQPREDPRPREAGRVRPTTSGYVEGEKLANGALGWKGIPFARAPLGQLRWRSPQAPYPWAGVRQTRVSGPPCVQFGPHPNSKITVDPGSEDCLYLDVQAPAGSTSLDGLPVVFWIHGGNNAAGAPPPMDTNLLVPGEQVVLVVPHYRLGGLGWFVQDALQTPEDPSGNYGLEDLLEALSWTRANIWAFGGDPDNITVFGESAGADNALALLSSPKAKGSLAKAILSNPGLSNPGTPPVTARQAKSFSGPDQNTTDEVIARLLMRDGLVRSRPAAAAYLSSADPQMLSMYLRSKSTADILSAYERAVDTAPIHMPTVVRDGIVVPLAERENVFSDAKAYGGVPIILGSGRDIAKTQMMSDPAFVTLNTFRSPIPKDVLRYDRIAHYRGLGYRTGSVDRFADTLLAGGNKSIFVYRLDWDEQASQLGSDYGFLMGAAAQSEVALITGSADAAPGGRALFATPGQESSLESVAGSMMSYIGAFVRHGNPGKGRTESDVQWSAWVKGDLARKKLVIDSDTGGGILMSAQRADGAFLEAEIAGDGSLATAAQKCAMAGFLNRVYGIWSEEDYAALLGGACLAPSPN